jgi:hypothetical protein
MSYKTGKWGNSYQVPMTKEPIGPLKTQCYGVSILRKDFTQFELLMLYQ